MFVGGSWGPLSHDPETGSWNLVARCRTLKRRGTRTTVYLLSRYLDEALNEPRK